MSSQLVWICSVLPKSPSRRWSNAFSIGSNGSFLQARMANSATSWQISATEFFPVASCSHICPAAKNVWTVIRFWVRVPVLSTHSTVAEPRVSIAGTWRVSTFFREILHAPSARNMVRTTGNSSGRIAIARVIPARSPSIQLPGSCRIRPR